MPRKQRVEYAGAVYHVISRGNYRKDLFADPKAAAAFEKTIFEVAERCGWNLYAYVIMSNHYHLAIETPEPNLVAGMKWLQSTFATRFNRFHGERGHVFQGRYRSLFVDSDRSLLGLIDYIHLNPVRARICLVENLKQFEFSSYPKLWKRVVQPNLDRKVILSLLGVADGVSGMRSYQKHLALCDESDPKNRDKLYQNYCRGWFIGSKKAKKELADELNRHVPGVDWEGVDLKELNESKWESFVVKELKKIKKTQKHIDEDLKGAAWKIETAKKVRKHTTASNPWLAQRLNMGHPSRVSAAMKGWRC
jgi:REP element-mobilizing transposase RayT